MSSITQEAIKKETTSSYGKFAVFGTTGEGKKLVIMKLGYNGGNEYVNLYSFSNDPSQDAPDTGVLYPFKDQEWSVAEEGDISYEQYWELMGADWAEQPVDGIISVEDAIAQLKVTTGRTYTISG